MTMLKIEPNVVDSTANFSFGNVTVSSLQTASGKVLDGVFEKNYNIPGGAKVASGTARWWVPTNLNISKINCNISTSPTGSGVNISINKNGTPIETTSIPMNSNTSSEDVSLAITAGDYITVDVTQVGSDNPGSDLVVTFLYYRT